MAKTAVYLNFFTHIHAGDWKATALLEAEVWAETVTEGGRRFMAAWRNSGCKKVLSYIITTTTVLYCIVFSSIKYVTHKTQ